MTTTTTDAGPLTVEQIRNIENDQAKLPGATRENLTVRTVQAAMIAQHGFCGDEDHCVCAREIGYRVCQPSARALLASKPAVPEGFVLVPVEPTEEMAKAYLNPSMASWKQRYRAMLAASPTAPAHAAGHTQCCDSPAFCSSVRRCTAKDATAPAQSCGEDTAAQSAAANKTFALVLMDAAAKSGDKGAMSLAMQLAGAAACEQCGFVNYHCRCTPVPAQSCGDAEQADEAVTVSEQVVFAWLVGTYVQRADDRQKSMGLQYTEAETHDLAKQIVNFIARAKDSK